MALNREISGIVIPGAAALVAALLYLLIGDDWYEQGHLQLCSSDNSFLEPAGRLPRPKSQDDLKQPTYWCYKPPPARLDDSACWETPRVSRPEEVTGAGQWDRVCGLEGEPDEGNILKNLFAGLLDWSRVVLRTAVEVAVGQWFWTSAIPAWNDFFAGADLQAAEFHRAAFAFIVAILWIAILSVMLKALYGRTHDKDETVHGRGGR